MAQRRDIAARTCRLLVLVGVLTVQFVAGCAPGVPAPAAPAPVAPPTAVLPTIAPAQVANTALPATNTSVPPTNTPVPPAPTPLPPAATTPPATTARVPPANTALPAGPTAASDAAATGGEATTEAAGAAPAAAPAATSAAVGPAAQTALCQGCHPRDQVLAQTANYEAGDGTLVQPHTTIDTSVTNERENPHLSGTGIVDCVNCHQPHPLPPTGAQVTKADLNYCYGTCHHTGNFTTCSSCH